MKLVLKVCQNSLIFQKIQPIKVHIYISHWLGFRMWIVVQVVLVIVFHHVPCACSRETGGEFAYTSRGLLRKDFLNNCISMSREPQKHHYFYCQDCPLERSKNQYLRDPCKGHLVRKFIIECWRKCGCSMYCGNRIVQRGITCKLQVILLGCHNSVFIIYFSRYKSNST